MKTKILLLIAACAIVTFSFTFASTQKSSNKTISNKEAAAEPAGGFAAEDKF